jgi:hypothetical protein
MTTGVIQVIREAKRTPQDVADRLARAGGLNRYGRPNYRAVWGWSRLGWIGGKWIDRDDCGEVIREVLEVRRVPKYEPFDRWHIERWIPPELYGSPARWYEMTAEIEGAQLCAALGPYPSEGEYEHCVTLEAHGNFLPLDAASVERIVRMIEFSRLVPKSASLAAIRAREEKRGDDFEKWAYDTLDDAVPALHGMPFVTVGDWSI